MSKIMIGCRIDPEIKTVLESTATLLGVTESKIVHDAIVKYLDLPQKQTALSRIDQVESEVTALRQIVDRLSRFLSNHQHDRNRFDLESADFRQG